MIISARKIIVFTLSTFILNLIWELAQGESGLYLNHGGDVASMLRCTTATFGDILIVLGIYIIMTIIYRSSDWILNMNQGKWVNLLLISLIAAIVVELWGLQTGRWSYSELMPIIPLIKIGLMPVLQMVLLVPLITLIVKKSNRYL